jgi:hypothetical protein
MKQHRWLAAVFSRALGALLCLSVCAVALTGAPASAQVYSTTIEAKLAQDLRPVVLQGQLEQKTFNWLNKEKGQWLVKVLIVSNNDKDTEVFDLRLAVMMAGG